MSGDKICTWITRIPADIDQGRGKLSEGVSVKLDRGHQRRPDRECDTLAGPGRVTRILKDGEEKQRVFPVAGITENSRKVLGTSCPMKLEHTWTLQKRVT